MPYVYEATLIRNSNSDMIDSMKIWAEEDEKAIKFAKREFRERHGSFQNLDPEGVSVLIKRLGKVDVEKKDLE